MSRPPRLLGAGGAFVLLVEGVQARPAWQLRLLSELLDGHAAPAGLLDPSRGPLLALTLALALALALALTLALALALALALNT